MNRQFRPFALALMAALAMPVLAEIPGIPADLPLRYAVSYNTSPAGEIEVSLDRHDQGYRLTSTTSPSSGTSPTRSESVRTSTIDIALDDA